MRRYWLIALTTFAVSLLPPGAAAGPKSGTIQVRVQPPATLVGGSVDVTVRVRCAPFGEHFESLITINQDDHAVFAERHFPVIQCDGTWHAYTLRATPFDGSFHRGPALASAYVSRQDPETGDLREGSDSRTIRIR